jgi:hypothetical protein
MPLENSSPWGTNCGTRGSVVPLGGFVLKPRTSDQLLVLQALSFRSGRVLLRAVVQSSRKIMTSALQNEGKMLPDYHSIYDPIEHQARGLVNRDA